MISRAALLTTLTDEALMALASVGLLRRAHKDREKQPPRLVEESDERFVIACEGGAATVTVPTSGAREARCTCPARQGCRHVLAACLVLREHLQTREGAPTEAPAETKPKTSGVATEGAGAASDAAPGEREAPPSPRPSNRPAGAKFAGAPRTRDEVLEAIRAALGDMVSLGFSRLSESSRDRLVTLAMSAHGVDLALLEKHLRTLAERVSSALAHDVTFHPRELLGAGSRAWVIATALAEHAEPRPESLVGQFRTRYDEVPGVLSLHGMGAWQWRTPSGYAGLTLAFWDEARQSWCTWTDSRPEFYTAGAFEPQRSYVQTSVWDAESPLRSSRRHLRLAGARRNPEGRLSSQGARVSTGDRTAPERVRMERLRFNDWSRLAEHLQEVQGPGIQESRPVDHLVLVTPAAWGRACWDEGRQEACLPLLDGGRRVLMLTVPHVEAWSFAVRTLETWEPEVFGTWGVLGFARIGPRGLVMDPVSFFNAVSLPPPFDSPILNLTLDMPIPGPRSTPRLHEREDAETHPCTFSMEALRQAARAVELRLPGAVERVPLTGPSPGAGGPAEGTTHRLASLLESALSVLESMAEAGVASTRPWQGQRLSEISQRLSQWGMDMTAAALRHAGVPPGESSGAAREPAGHLLWAWWLIQAASEQADLAWAAAETKCVTLPVDTG